MYGTRTATYTIVDVRRAFEGFEADLRMIARRTEKWTIDYVDKVFHDVIRFAEAKYIKEMNLTLLDAKGTPIKAAKYIVDADGRSVSGDRAGGNIWPCLPSTSLILILSYTRDWTGLSTQQQQKFKEENDFQIGWEASSVDTSFRNLIRTNAQVYASNGYELKKYNFS